MTMEQALQRKLRGVYGRRDFNGKHRKARVAKFQAAQRKKKNKRGKR